MKVFKRSLAVILALCMMLGVVPFTAFASENTSAYSTGSTEFMRVFHLDCGRKYFTVDQIKELIDAISAAHYTHMELAIGNDGLRFLLDDMSVTANGTTYASETVKSGIKSGNAAYAHSGEWSQDEMHTIIAYADSKNIEIIPLVNTPGHMDAILAAMSACGIDGYYETSARTVDLENEKAVAFTQALVMKYAKYFKDKGCKYFNIGADEYANDYHEDASTGMGFGYLIDSDKYGNFITYVNTLVEDICDLGMTPVAFNDGIYFRENTSYGTFDNRLVVAAWTGGYSGIKPASTTFLVNKGHKILNTNERWYYVLGRVQSSNVTYCYESALANAKIESVTTVTDHVSGVTPIGAMQCVWCDDPSVSYSETNKNNVMTLISTLSSNNSEYFKEENVTVTDTETQVSVTAVGLGEVTVEAVAASAIEGAEEVKAYNIKPADYTGSAVVSIPVDADWNNVRGGVMASENGEEKLGIVGVLENGVFTFKVPHFSTVVVYDLADTAAVPTTVEVALKVGETSETYTDNSGYHTIAEGLNTDIATARLDGNAGSEATIEYVEKEISYVELLASDSTKYKTEYFVIDSEGEFHHLYVTRETEGILIWKETTYTYYYSDDGVTFEDYGKPVTPDDTDSIITEITIFEKSGNEAVPAKTTVSFTGVSVGETTATIGSTTYKITVSRKTESVTITTGETKTISDNSTTAVSSNSSVATAAISDGTLTITAVAIGDAVITTDSAVYNVTVVDFDPSAVTPLTVEYWITNLTTRTIESTTTNPVISQQISASASGVATAEGADINAMVPEWTIKRDGDSQADREVEFWHVRLLDKNQTNNSTNGTEEQTTDSADDETTSGDAVTRVRYYDPGDDEGRRWQLLSGTTWLDVDQTNNQIVAYYMEVIDIKNATTGNTEVHVNAADWGKLGDNSPASSYADTSKYCSISLQIVYEDGTTTNPASTSAADLASKTIIYNYWDGGRGIGTFAFDTMGQFRIYQVTAETGAVTARFTAGSDGKEEWGTALVTGFEWDDNEKVVWSGASETVSLNNNAKYPDDTDPKDNLMWNENREAILIRIYVKAIETSDSLTVHYIDRSANDLEFYNYFITTPAGEVFKEGFDMTGNGLELVNNNVTNYYDGQQRYVSADLQTMPEIKAYYRYCNYTLVDVVRSTDGKDVYLYYTFTPVVSFVADFGLPIEITPTDLNQAGYSTEGGSITAVKVIGSKDTMAGSTANSEYGTLSVSGTTVTYTPDEILQGVDFFSVYVETTADNPNTTTDESAGINYRVYIFPATTVYYEEGFLFNADSTGWNNITNKGTDHQKTEVLGEHTYNYGYDPVYAGDAKGSAAGSDVTYAEAPVSKDAANTGASTSFTFTGTGFELYANSKEATGIVSVLNKSNKLTKLYRIDTKLMDGDTGITTYADGDATTEDKTYYSLPIISETDLEHGEYTVTIKQNNGVNGALYIDGVRIINTVDQTGKTCENNIYYTDKEDNPDFYELRDMVLHAAGVGDLKESDYISQNNRDGLVAEIEQMAGQVYNNVNGATAIIIDESLSYADSKTLQDLLDNGPKNELYLSSGQTLSFSVNTNRVLQLGLKAPKGEAIFKVTVDGTDKTVGEETTITNSDDESETWGKITSTVDMFYKIADQIANSETTTTHTVTITVKSGLLSVTKLKICDDPNAAFVALTQEDIENALLGIYGLTDDKTPVEPEEPAAEADAVLAITLTDGKKEMGTAELTAVGAEGEKHTFTAEEILNAVLDAMPDLYKVSDESAIADVAVKYGETGKLTVDIELEFEFDMDSWWRQVRTLMNRIFTIIADAGKGGSITNEGSADVKFRKDITYTITPDEGYEIESVIVDGKDVGAVSEYTFRRVRNDHRISVTFKEVQ